MKVFAVIIDEVIECCATFSRPFLSITKETAQKYYNDCIDDAKKDYETSINNGWIVEESKDCFDIWEDGYYCQNHYSIRIEELEIVEE